MGRRVDVAFSGSLILGAGSHFNKGPEHAQILLSVEGSGTHSCRY